MPTPEDTPAQSNRPRRKWIKSTKSSGNGCCVEVCFDSATDSAESRVTNVLVRDSKFPRDEDSSGREPIIEVDRQTWLNFLDRVSVDGHVAASPGLLRATVQPNSAVHLRSLESGVELRFTRPEWEAFVGGVIEGELR